MNYDLAILAASLVFLVGSVVAVACVDLGWRRMWQTFIVAVLATVATFSTVLWLGFMGIVE